MPAGSMVQELSATASRNSLYDSQVSDELDRLHRDAKNDWRRHLRALPGFIGARLRGYAPGAYGMGLFHATYFSITPEQGRFLYQQARTIGARRIVEFGTSFGVSTLYLAAAVRDNGGGRVTGTELEPGKHAQAVRNIEAAGLSAYAEVRLGDALTTLADIEGPVDLVFLDGWKELYLPVMKLLLPRLRPGSVVLADNVLSFPDHLAAYVEFMRADENGFVSTLVPLGGGLEFSVFRP